MSWLDRQVTVYKSHADTIGRDSSLGEVLLDSSFSRQELIRELRELDEASADYELEKKNLKGKLNCLTPAGRLKSRKKNNVVEINRTGMLQLDFDHKDIQDYDLEELKQCVFSLPFIAWCERSCSGKGFYALAAIAEPYKLKDYAEHCFNVFIGYGLKPDTSKGRKVQDLRYVSYDVKPLMRDNPESLRIKHFNTPTIASKPNKVVTTQCSQGLLKWAINEIEKAEIGNRFRTIQKVAYTLGGRNTGLNEIKQAINYSNQYTGVEAKYILCAEECYSAGMSNPFNSLK